MNPIELLIREIVRRRRELAADRRHRPEKGDAASGTLAASCRQEDPMGEAHDLERMPGARRGVKPD